MTTRLFLIHKGNLYLMKPDAGMNHLQYAIHNELITHQKHPEYENLIRGYVQDGVITAYQGSRFHSPNRADMRQAFQRLLKVLNLPDDTEVIWPVSKGEKGRRWYHHNNRHRLELVKWRINPAIFSKQPKTASMSSK